MTKRDWSLLVLGHLCIALGAGALIIGAYWVQQSPLLGAAVLIGAVVCLIGALRAVDRLWTRYAQGRQHR
jgi:hypothetical protein